MEKTNPHEKKSAPAETVDDYLAAVADEPRAALEQLRKTIKDVVPEAVEVISCRIPPFKYRERRLVAYAAFKNHCSFHLMSPPLAHSIKDQFKPHDVSGATIHFSAEKLLPAELAKTINVRLAFTVSGSTMREGNCFGKNKSEGRKGEA